MNPPLWRRLVAEFTGTGLLVAIVVGSGIAATSMTSYAALRLLINSLVTAMGLAVLILIFMPAGGAQFNPVVTAADWLLGRRTEHRYGIGQAATVMLCQIAGAIAGSALADAMFGQELLTPSHKHRGGTPLLLSEVVATAGLLLVIVGIQRGDHSKRLTGRPVGCSEAFARRMLTGSRGCDQQDDAKGGRR